MSVENANGVVQFPNSTVGNKLQQNLIFSQINHKIFRDYWSQTIEIRACNTYRKQLSLKLLKICVEYHQK